MVLLLDAEAYREFFILCKEKLGILINNLVNIWESGWFGKIGIIVIIGFVCYMFLRDWLD